MPAWALGALAAALAFGALQAGAGAAVIDVKVQADFNNNSANGCGLREAIRSANEDFGIGNCDAGDPGKDTIRVEPGTYELTMSGIDSGAFAGDLDINDSVKLVGLGKGFTVDAGGDGGIDDRIFEIRGTAKATITNARLRNGHTVLGEDGGAFLVEPDAALKLTRANLIANEATDPGASSGAIESEGILRLRDVAIRKSFALNIGAINSTGSAVLRRVTVNGSRAAFAGGAVRAGGDMSIVDSTISGNRLEPSGGTHAGGGLSVVTIPPDEVVVRNSTISGNRSDQNGGGIAVSQGLVRLIHTTVSENTADADSAGTVGDGGGIWVDTDADAELRASAFHGNVDDSIAVPVHRDCSGDVTSLGFNLIHFQFGCNITAAPGADDDLPGATDPKLKPFGNYGGPTRTYALRASSPLVDLIPKAKCHDGAGVDPEPIRRDQRGVKRPQGGRCDGGSFELEQ